MHVVVVFLEAKREHSGAMEAALASAGLTGTARALDVDAAGAVGRVEMLA